MRTEDSDLPPLAEFLAFAVLESGDGQGWGSVGPVTTDSGAWPFGSDGFGRFHTGDFDMVGWGMVDVSPLTTPLLDLSGFSGISVDAHAYEELFYSAGLIPPTDEPPAAWETMPSTRGEP